VVGWEVLGRRRHVQTVTTDHGLTAYFDWWNYEGRTLFTDHPGEVVTMY